MAATRRGGVRRVLGAAALATSAAVLTGCGIHPGSAAVVGSAEIAPDEVDRAADVVCLVDQTVGGVQAVARRKAVELLVGTELIQMWGRAENALPRGSQISPALQQAERDAQLLPARVRQDYLDIVERILAAQQIRFNVGQQELGSQSGSIGSEGAVDEALAAGAEAYDEWLAQSAPEVSVDPRYGSWEGGTLVAGDASLSVAVSDEARQLAGGTGQLPPTQLCS